MTNSPSNSIAQTDKSPKTAIHSLYVLKAICAFIVVMIHTPPLENIVDNSIFTPFVFIGVPIFYMVTGYFLYHTDSKQIAQRAWKSSRKVLLATILLNLIYLTPLLLNGKMPIGSVDDLLQLLAFGTKIEGALWYMTALFYALVIIGGLAQIGLSKLLKYSLILIPLGILFGRYAFLIGADRAVYSEFNVLLALPYISLGFTLREYESKLLLYKWELMSLVFLLLSCIEVFILGTYFSGYWGRYLFTPILSTAVFMWCLQNKSWGENSFLAQVGSEYSGNIYYLHKLIAFGLRGTIVALGIDIFYDKLGVLYVFAISLVAAMISVGIQKRLGISWLR